MPDWYPTFIAAEECHCPPWQLAEQSVYWRDKALIKRQAEKQAQKELSKHK